MFIFVYNTIIIIIARYVASHAFPKDGLVTDDDDRWYRGLTQDFVDGYL